ncbi:hypothetical protein CA54_09440 [Symmachiella macrocystis]|uniref:Uncharacterized protein n=1 Tax=Symmachiella macrocystis TaxID=2527985 RepID=A0A5C6BL86_9PLAN|nr:hypothetical protein CA54_09440 [Symmachiella macrocystis]
MRMPRIKAQIGVRSVSLSNQAIIEFINRLRAMLTEVSVPSIKAKLTSLKTLKGLN